MKDKPIGVFDSGLGGLAVARKVFGIKMGDVTLVNPQARVFSSHPCGTSVPFPGGYPVRLCL